MPLQGDLQESCLPFLKSFLVPMFRTLLVKPIRTYTKKEDIFMKKTEKSKLAVRIMCIALAALMVLGVAYSGIYFLFQ